MKKGARYFLFDEQVLRRRRVYMYISIQLPSQCILTLGLGEDS